MNALWLLVDILTVLAAGWQAERRLRVPRRARDQRPAHLSAAHRRAQARSARHAA